MKFLLMSVFVVALGWSVSSCDTIDAAFDCNAVCTRYRDCFDHNYDVATCRSNCRAAAARDPNQRAKADACASCIDDQSCAAATFTCSTQCVGIVP
jgi:hypothetical protein